MYKYGSWDGPGLGTGIALPGTHPHPPPRVHPPAPTATTQVFTGTYRGLKLVVGLISVEQLTLSARISGFQGITEVYNLVRIHRISNHSFIPGTKQAGVSNPWTGGVSCQQSSIKGQITPILDHWFTEVGIWASGGPSGDQSGDGPGGSF